MKHSYVDHLKKMLLSDILDEYHEPGNANDDMVQLGELENENNNTPKCTNNNPEPDDTNEEGGSLLVEEILKANEVEPHTEEQEEHKTIIIRSGWK